MLINISRSLSLIDYKVLVLFWGFKVDGEALPSEGGHVRITLLQLSL